jgi:hypothetical protein
MEIPRAFLDEKICCLRGYVQKMKAELIFNFDEVGRSEWEYRKKRKVIVSKTMVVQTIHHRASQSLKHISIITDITAGGESLTPYIMTSQDFKPLHRRLMRHAIRIGVDFVLRQ